MSVFQPWLVVFGLGLDIWGVLLIINEWRLGALSDHFNALKSDVLFYRNLRHKFTPEEAKHISEARRAKEIELARIYGDAHELSSRYEERKKLIVRGRALIVLGFILQIVGSLPLSQLCLSADTTCGFFWSGGIGALLIAAVVLASLRPVRFSFLGTDENDAKFSGSWMSYERNNDPSRLDLLWLNIESRRGDIVGITQPNSLEIEDWNRFLEIRGKRQGEIADIQITEYEGTEPYPYASATLTLDRNEFVWQLTHGGTGNFPKHSRLHRLN